MAIGKIQEAWERKKGELERKAAVKEYRRQLDVFGNEILDRVPYDLKDAVIGAGALESSSMINGRSLDNLQKISPERRGTSPENILRTMLGNGTIELDGGGQSVQEKLLARYPKKTQ